MELDFFKKFNSEINKLSILTPVFSLKLNTPELRVILWGFGIMVKLSLFFICDIHELKKNKNRKNSLII